MNYTGAKQKRWEIKKELKRRAMRAKWREKEIGMRYNIMGRYYEWVEIRGECTDPQDCIITAIYFDNWDLFDYHEALCKALGYKIEQERNGYFLIREN